MTKKKETERLWQFDYWKAACIIFVIILHVSWTAEQKRFVLFPFMIHLAVPGFMLISGYMNARSCDQKGMNTLRKCFSVNLFIRKAGRILVPFTIAYLIEIILHINYLKEILTLGDIIKIYILGGWGPGAYYIPVVMQMLLLSPFLYYFIKRTKKWGCLAILFAQLMLEIGFQCLSIDEKWYGFLFFRFLSFALMGILFYEFHTKLQKWHSYLMLFLGAIYIMAITYTSYKPSIFPYWTEISMPTALWIGGLFLLGLFTMKRKLPQKAHEIISLIGKASWYIFLVQKLYYGTGLASDAESLIVQTLVNIIVCVGIGCALFLAENKIFRKDKVVKK